MFDIILCCAKGYFPISQFHVTYACDIIDCFLQHIVIKLTISVQNLLLLDN